MKKLKLLLLGVMFISSTVFSQELLISNASQMGKWTGDEWKWDDWIYSELRFVLEGNTIIVNDEANSSYITYGEPEYTNDVYYWKAFDEQHIPCSFGMTAYEKNNLILIMYNQNNLCFKYAIKKL